MVQQDQSGAPRFTLTLLDVSPVPTIAIDSRLIICHVNRVFTETFGWLAEELVGTGLARALSDCETSVQEGIRNVAAARNTRGFACRIPDRRGNQAEVIVNRVEIADSAGSNDVCLLTFGDSRMDGTPGAFLESERQYVELVKTARDLIYVTDHQGFLTLVNPVAMQLTGYPEEELIGKHYLDMIRSDHRERAERFFGIQFVKRLPETYVELPLKTKAGGSVWLGVKTQLVMEEDQVMGFQAIARDITERKRAEDALRQSEEKYRTILENIEEGYYEVNLAGDMVLCNDAMCRILGYSRDELIGMNNRQYMQPDVAKKVYGVFNRVYSSGKPEKTIGWELVRKDGTIRAIEASVSLIRDAEGEAIGFRGIVRDITDRRRMEQRLLQSQKMESIGTLAGGIAHDFNNILFAITGFSEMALEEAPEESLIKSNLEQVLQAAGRARDLVRQILTFSRQSEEERRSIDIAPIIKETFKFLRASIPTTIEMRSDIEPHPGAIRSHPTLIHQILMNLCSNAAYAMRDGGGVLRVGLHQVRIDETKAAAALDLEPGSYVQLTVSDTGEGIDAAIFDRIFDPYFTTKGPGEGTGLGLAVVHGIVKSHHGAITVESEPGAGTAFKLFFPLVHESVAETGLARDGQTAGQGRVLFVDDEESIVEMGRQMLERIGYRVVATTSSVDALDLFRAEPEAFDLLVTDMTMPKMTGKDLAGEIVKIRPDLPVIVCTGFDHVLSEEEMESLGVKALIRKPVLRTDLAAAIGKALMHSSE